VISKQPEQAAVTQPQQQPQPTASAPQFSFKPAGNASSAFSTTAVPSGSGAFGSIQSIGTTAATAAAPTTSPFSANVTPAANTQPFSFAPPAMSNPIATQSSAFPMTFAAPSGGIGGSGQGTAQALSFGRPSAFGSSGSAIFGQASSLGSSLGGISSNVASSGPVSKPQTTGNAGVGGFAAFAAAPSGFSALAGSQPGTSLAANQFSSSNNASPSSSIFGQASNVIAPLDNSKKTGDQSTSKSSGNLPSSFSQFR
jgi:hypothetical protein